MTRTALLFTTAAVLAVLSLLLSPGAGQRPAPRAQAAPGPAEQVPFPPTFTQGGLPTVVDFPAAGRGDGLGVRLQLSRTRWSAGQTVYAKLSVRAPEQGAVVPASMVLVLDRSGSMAGEKWAQARRAASALIAALSPGDELAVVAFDSDVKSMPLTPADVQGKARLEAFVDGLAPTSGTNIGAALSEAERLLEQRRESGRSRRVILVSDGQPTEGMLTAEGLAAAARALHAGGAAVSALGVGLDFDQRVMRAIAEEGAGFYAFLEQAGGLAEVLAKELTLAHHTVAHQVEVVVSVPEGLRLSGVAGRQFRRVGERVVRFSFPDLGPGHQAQAYLQLEVVKAASGQVRALVTSLAPSADTSRTEAASVDGRPAELFGEEGAGVDGRVEAEGVRAFANEQVFAATAAFEQGDKSLALSLLDRARSMLGTSSDALAGSEATDLVDVRRHWEKTSDATEMRRSSMNLANKKMANFGQNNAY